MLGGGEGKPGVDKGYAAKVEDDVDVVFWESGSAFGWMNGAGSVSFKTIETFFDSCCC